MRSLTEYSAQPLFQSASSTALSIYNRADISNRVLQRSTDKCEQNVLQPFEGVGRWTKGMKSRESLETLLSQ